ncbi:hypothetical protein V5799_006447 [Amblyomma americanum]|uniref:Uncharacterized protein n=1 Tax=Amblyomma americanum TaxID=6943 RepID=A0AAQ4DWD4_AMBAM
MVAARGNSATGYESQQQRDGNSMDSADHHQCLAVQLRSGPFAGVVQALHLCYALEAVDHREEAMRRRSRGNRPLHVQLGMHPAGRHHAVRLHGWLPAGCMLQTSPRCRRHNRCLD